MALAKEVGPEGKIYAVDSDAQAIRAVEQKATKRNYQNIETHASSASDLSFINDKSVDFILAEGLLCSMAPRYRESTVNEIRRILKPNGKAYLGAGLGRWSNINRADWEKLLEKVKVERRSDEWAVVSTVYHNVL